MSTDAHLFSSRWFAASVLLTSLAIPVPGQETVVPEEFAPLRARWLRAMEKLDVPGVSIAAVRDGEIVYLDALGVRDDRGRPVTTETGFYIASATKPFVAMAVLTLAQQGKVDLDAAVKTYLPRFQLADDTATREVTVRDLLCHRRGLNNGAIVFLDAYTGEITEDRYYHFLAEVSAGDVAYTNVNFTLAGKVVEAVTGKNWQDYLKEAIFDGHVDAIEIAVSGRMAKFVRRVCRSSPMKSEAVGLELRRR